jgi:hypothetical protein
MLVLDEQLLGRDLDTALAHWYRGPVLFITDLRPGTVIKDDAIPIRHYRKVFISWQRYRSSPALIGVYAESYALRTLSP